VVSAGKEETAKATTNRAAIATTNIFLISYLLKSYVRKIFPPNLIAKIKEEYSKEK
jgi:hypothetical protein